MIKFFRKIRQKLLSGNPPAGWAGKFKNYLLYAIGEIVLVVIGILIALQVNTWNQNRLDAREEKQLFQAIQTKMDHNKFQVKNGFKRYSEVINSSKQLIKLSTEEPTSTLQKGVNNLIHNLHLRLFSVQSTATQSFDVYRYPSKHWT